MKYLKKLGFSFIYVLLSLFILTFIITIFNYFDVINDKIASIINIIIPIISMFIGGFYIGGKSLKLGYIEGLKLGGIFSFILLLFNVLIFNNKFEIKYLLFYIILIISSILGSMVGINIKKRI